MAMDDEANVNWVSYIIASLLESVHKYHAPRKSKNVCNEVHFELLVSYLLEQRMLQVDRGEELANSNFLLCRNIRRK